MERQRRVRVDARGVRGRELGLVATGVGDGDAGNRFRSELKWIRRGAKARSTKQKARIQRFDQLSEDLQSTSDNTSLELSMQSQRLGKKIIEGENLGVSYGDHEIFHSFDFLLQGGDRIG